MAAAPQAPRGRRSRLNPKYTFDSFIVGKSNELAHGAAHAVADRPGAVYNPLVIYSKVGLGKTHLLHAIGRLAGRKAASLIYTTAEDFTSEYISAIREGKTEEFRETYRAADVLLLDDIHFLIGKEQTQEGFFHTFNALHMSNRQMVITSDRPVTALTLLEDRIQSRLEGGLVVDIQPPGLEERSAILRAKAEARGLDLHPVVLEMLAERVRKNVRELEGVLNRVVAYADLTQSRITPDLAARAMAEPASAGLERPRIGAGGASRRFEPLQGERARDEGTQAGQADHSRAPRRDVPAARRFQAGIVGDRAHPRRQEPRHRAPRLPHHRDAPERGRHPALRHIRHTQRPRERVARHARASPPGRGGGVASTSAAASR